MVVGKACSAGYDRGMTQTNALRNPCPPGACDCQRDQPLADPRILRLTKAEELRLLTRIEALQSLEDLQHLQLRMYEQLGIDLQVVPGASEVRTARGLHMQFAPQQGLCRKTRQNIAGAIRRAIEQRPEIAWRLLDSFDLFAGL